MWKLQQLIQLKEKENAEDIIDQQELFQYAEYIGLHLPDDEDLLYIAKEGYSQKLPLGWHAYQTPTNDIVYYSAKSKEMLNEHPLDQIYRQKVREAKIQIQEEESQYSEEKELSEILQDENEQKNESQVYQKTEKVRYESILNLNNLRKAITPVGLKELRQLKQHKQIEQAKKTKGRQYKEQPLKNKNNDKRLALNHEHSEHSQEDLIRREQQELNQIRQYWNFNNNMLDKKISNLNSFDEESSMTSKENTQNKLLPSSLFQRVQSKNNQSNIVPLDKYKTVFTQNIEKSRVELPQKPSLELFTRNMNKGSNNMAPVVRKQSLKLKINLEKQKLKSAPQLDQYQFQKEQRQQKQQKHESQQRQQAQKLEELNNLQQQLKQLQKQQTLKMQLLKNLQLQNNKIMQKIKKKLRKTKNKRQKQLIA